MTWKPPNRKLHPDEPRALVNSKGYYLVCGHCQRSFDECPCVIGSDRISELDKA